MKLNQVRIGFLCTATLLSPALVYSQTPSSMPNNQPTQPGQQPNSGVGSGSGMAGSMTGGTAGSNDPSGQMARDKMFLRKAAEGGMAEIQLGQLALQKSNSDDVKQFAQKMIDDHTTLNNSMKPIADQMGVPTPTKLARPDQAEYDKLSGMSGDDFDKEYLGYMSKDHHKDLRDFKMEDSTVTDSSLKAAVDSGLPVIQQHTQMVDKLAKSKGVTMPGHGAAGMAPGQ